MKSEKYLQPFSKIKFHELALNIPVTRNKPTMYFVNSMSDTFHLKDISQFPEYLRIQEYPNTKIFKR